MKPLKTNRRIKRPSALVLFLFIGGCTGATMGAVGPDAGGAADANAADGATNLPDATTTDTSGPDARCPDCAVSALFPIEVVGDDGFVDGREVHVSSAGQAAQLFLQGHALGYQLTEYSRAEGLDQKASVRLNEGEWIPIDNERSTCFPREEALGCIGGGASTVRLTMPLAAGAVTDGINRIEFRFNRTDGTGSGFRILDLDIQDAAGASLLARTEKLQEDPSAWEPVRSSPEDFQRGAELFAQRHLLVAGPHDPSPVVASCADCHAADGRDLWYFNFSNRSIEARSRFHGLSQEDAEKISSWIRALPAYGEDAARFQLPDGLTVSDLGRPWNPPYQPGPGTDSRHRVLWSAGAGIGNVLDEDEHMAEYLFPGGITPDEVRRVANTQNRINMRELPVALEFPDILTWWPDIHPLEVVDETAWNESQMMVYYNDLSQLGDPAFLQERIDRQASGLRSDTLEHRLNLFEDSAGRFFSSQETTDPDNLRNNVIAMSFKQWRAMKLWETMLRYDLEALAPTVYPETDEHKQGEALSWIGNRWQVFSIAPHRSVRTGDYPGNTPLAEPMLNTYSSHVWYQLQFSLNAGNYRHSVNNPVDWKYHLPHLHNNAGNTDRGAYFLLLASFIRTVQLNDLPGTPNVLRWFLRHIMPTALVGRRRDGVAVRSNVNDEQYRILVAGVLDAWLDGAIRQHGSPGDTYGALAWPRGESQEELEPMDYVPTAYGGSGYYYPNGLDWATKFYRMCDHLEELGIDGAVIDKLARWGEAMWPLGDWEAHFR